MAKNQPKPAAGAEQTTKQVYTVARRFQDAPQYRDGENRKYYEVGADVSHFDEDRLENLVARGSVVVSEVTVDVEPEAAPTGEGAQPADTGTDPNITEAQ